MNVDISEKQLAACGDCCIVPMRASAERVLRSHLVGEDEICFDNTINVALFWKGRP